MTDGYMKVRFVHGSVRCAFPVYTVCGLESLSLNTRCQVSIAVLNFSVVTLRGCCGMIGFFMVRSAVSLDEIDIG